MTANTFSVAMLLPFNTFGFIISTIPGILGPLCIYV